MLQGKSTMDYGILNLKIIHSQNIYIVIMLGA